MRQPMTKIVRKAPSCLPAYACADDLDSCHERQRQEHGPGKREAELCAGLRVGSDSAWVVVRCSGNQPRAECVRHSSNDDFPPPHSHSLLRRTCKTWTSSIS